MGLLDGGLAGLAREAGVPESTQKDTADTYRKPMNPDDFDSFGESNLTQGEESEIARYEVPAGVERRFGFGRADLDANQGYLYGKLQNADAEEIDGTVTFKWENATGRRTQVVDEAKTGDMSTANRYDREQQRPFPEDTTKNKASENQYLVVTFTPSTDPANITNNYGVDQTDSEARWPTTEYDIS